MKPNTSGWEGKRAAANALVGDINAVGGHRVIAGSWSAILH